MAMSKSIEPITLRLSPFVFLKWVTIILFFLPLLALALAFFVNVESLYAASALARSYSFNLAFSFVTTALQLVAIAVAFGIWSGQKYSFSPQTVRVTRPPAFEQRDLLATQEIGSIEIKQGRLARQFDYGSLELTDDRFGQKIVLKNIPTPAYYAQTLQSMIAPKDRAMADKQKPVAQLLAEGENQNVEFKSSFVWDYRRQTPNKALRLPIMKNVAAFMNASGGVVVVGVDDEGQVLGLENDFSTLRKPDVDGLELVFNNNFNQMIGAEHRLHVDVTFAPVEGKTICILSVNPSPIPIFLNNGGKEQFYVRTGNASQPLTISQAMTYIDAHFAG